MKELLLRKRGLMTASGSDDEAVGSSYLTFASPASFTLSFENIEWDGALYYSTDAENWNLLGSEIISSDYSDYMEVDVIYICGVNNTYVRNISLTGSLNGILFVGSIFLFCMGYIESLLDGGSVSRGEEINAADYCFSCLFYGCTTLYRPPSFSASIVPNYGYNYMFGGCTYLNYLPYLPAVTIGDSGYRFMFYRCSNIKVSSTYNSSSYPYEWRLPSTGTATTGASSLSYMLSNTGGTYTSTPSANTTYYTNNQPV